MSQEIYLDDDEPLIVGKMTGFLYALDYDDHPTSSLAEPANEATSPASLLINAKVYVIADKYELNALKKLACTKYKEALPITWNTSIFSKSASLVFDNTVETDRMLRDVIVQVASDNARALLDRGEFVEMLKHHGDIATEIMRMVITKYDQIEEPRMDPDAWLAGCKKKKGRRLKSSLVEA